MRFVVCGLLLLLALVLETAGVPGIAFGGVKPELMLMLTLLAAMIMPLGEAVGVGFAAGLAQDLVVGRFITLHAGAFVLVALAVGLVVQRFYRENFLVRLCCLLFGTALGEVMYLLGAASFGLSRPWTVNLWSRIAVVSIVNAVLGTLLYRPLARLYRRLLDHDELVKRTG